MSLLTLKSCSSLTITVTDFVVDQREGQRIIVDEEDVAVDEREHRVLDQRKRHVEVKTHVFMFCIFSILTSTFVGSRSCVSREGNRRA
jgi:nitrate reductase NapE component